MDMSDWSTAFFVWRVGGAVAIVAAAFIYRTNAKRRSDPSRYWFFAILGAIAWVRFCPFGPPMPVFI
jgi:hypothetical protein